MKITDDELVKRFNYHPPRNDQEVAQHDQIRNELLAVAGMIVDLTPASREQSLAVTKIEEAMMWANAALARHRT